MLSVSARSAWTAPAGSSIVGVRHSTGIDATGGSWRLTRKSWARSGRVADLEPGGVEMRTTPRGGEAFAVFVVGVRARGRCPRLAGVGAMRPGREPADEHVIGTSSSVVGSVPAVSLALRQERTTSVRLTIRCSPTTGRRSGLWAGLIGCIEQAGDHVGRLPVARLEEVGVDVQRGCGVGVAESTADRPHRHPGCEQLRGVQVAEVVEPDAAPGRLAGRAVGTRRDRVGVQRA